MMGLSFPRVDSICSEVVAFADSGDVEEVRRLWEEGRARAQKFLTDFDDFCQSSLNRADDKRLNGRVSVDAN